MTDDKWRAILLADVQPLQGNTWAGWRALMTEFKTLGDLADAQEGYVLRMGNVGPTTVKQATDIIRRAMAGEDVTRRRREARTIGDMARGDGV